ncbi:hypothetical protein B2G71_15125 [Novosphingobium sp. PC22D]|nr:hypothetical protein B2G71_15125 [Novosphingobium sp. PC22D]
MGGAIGSALLRHVSAEGCQLLLESRVIRVGMRLSLALEPSIRVAGTVRWIVAGRAGFEFDQALTSRIQALLEPTHPLPSPVTIYPA